MGSSESDSALRRRMSAKLRDFVREEPTVINHEDQPNPSDPDDPGEGTSDGRVRRKKTKIHHDTIEPYDEILVYSDKEFEVYAYRKIFVVQENFSTEDSLFGFYYKPLSRTHTPKITEVYPAITAGIAAVIDLLKEEYAKLDNKQIYMAIIDPSMKRSLNTGNMSLSVI